MTSIYANSERPQRRAPRCGNCGGEGHNRRTCPTAERLRNAMDEDRWRREAAEAAAEVERQQRRQQARREHQRAHERRRIEQEQIAHEQQQIAREQLRRAEQQQREFEHRQRMTQETEREQARRQRTSSNRLIIDGLVIQADQEQRAWDLAQHALDRMARRMAQPMPRPEPAPAPAPAPAPRRRVQQHRHHDTDDETEPIDLKKVAEMPILRDTAIEMDDCPICMETLGETGKVVLKCGHSLCQGCFLQQMVHSTVIKKNNDCACPVCRVKYIK